MHLKKCNAQALTDIKHMCENDFLAFIELFFKVRLSQDFLVNWHHIKIIDALMAVVRGDIQNLCITQPPGSSKTEVGVIAWMAWCLARNPWCRFLHLSGSADLAELNSVSTKEIVESEEYQFLWPITIRKDTKAKRRWNIDQNGKKAGGVYATSTGGQITGFRAGYMTEGFSGAIIVDDPLKAEDAWSKAKRFTANRRITNTIRSRRATTNTPVILIMQRLHEKDPAALALEGELAMEFHHIEIQGIQNYGHEEECSYWEEKESLQSLKELEAKDPYTFWSQYQQRPTPAGGAMIKEEYIHFYKVLPEIKSVGIFADTAQKTGQHNDYSVLMLCGTDGVNLYVIDVIRKKMTAPVLEETTIDFYHKHKPHRVTNNVRFEGLFVEDKVSGTGLIQNIRAKTSIPVIAMQRNIDKITRCNDCLPFFRAGQIFLPEDALFTKDLVLEMLAFSPEMTHAFDDQCDALFDAIQEFLGEKKTVIQGADWS